MRTTRTQLIERTIDSRRCLIWHGVRTDLLDLVDASHRFDVWRAYSECLFKGRQTRCTFRRWLLIFIPRARLAHPVSCASAASRSAYTWNAAMPSYPATRFHLPVCRPVSPRFRRFRLSSAF